MSILCKLLDEELHSWNVPTQTSLRHTWATTASDYICRIEVTALKVGMIYDAVKLKVAHISFMQWAVALNTLYSSKTGSFGTIHVTKIVHRNDLNGTNGTCICWLAKVQRLIIVFRTEKRFLRCPKSVVSIYKEWYHYHSDDPCTVRGYEIMKRSNAFINGINRTLDCIRMIWHQNSGKEA